MPWLGWGWGATAAAERRMRELDERRAAQHKAAVAKRRKAKRGGKR